MVASCQKGSRVMEARALAPPFAYQILIGSPLSSRLFPFDLSLLGTSHETSVPTHTGITELGEDSEIIQCSQHWGEGSGREGQTSAQLGEVSYLSRALPVAPQALLVM